MMKWKYDLLNESDAPVSYSPAVRRDPSVDAASRLIVALHSGGVDRLDVEEQDVALAHPARDGPARVRIIGRRRRIITGQLLSVLCARI